LIPPIKHIGQSLFFISPEESWLPIPKKKNAMVTAVIIYTKTNQLVIKPIGNDIQNEERLS
jgi:hypothetical protein